MTATIQIKDVPEDLHRRIKARAEAEGRSVSQIVLQEVGRSFEHPGLKEVLDEIAAQPELQLRPSPAEVIREARDAR